MYYYLLSYIIFSKFISRPKRYNLYHFNICDKFKSVCNNFNNFNQIIVDQS